MNRAEFIWDGKFYQYGIGLKLNEQPSVSGHQIWDISNNGLWGKFIGSTIYNVSICWEWVTTEEAISGKKEKYIYPQDITLSFTNGRNIYISASGFVNTEDDAVYGLLDNLTVTDNKE